MRYFVALTSVVALTLPMAVAPAFSQEWSPAQKDVWKNVEHYWSLGAEEKLEELLGYFDEEYMGWSYEQVLPYGKASVKKWSSHFYETSEPLLHEIKPVAIEIHGDVALVFYYFTSYYKNEEGKHKTRQGRWIDILKKQGDKRVLIGDHGGETKSQE